VRAVIASGSAAAAAAAGFHENRIGFHFSTFVHAGASAGFNHPGLVALGADAVRLFLCIGFGSVATVVAEGAGPGDFDGFLWAGFADTAPGFALFGSARFGLFSTYSHFIAV